MKQWIVDFWETFWLEHAFCLHSKPVAFMLAVWNGTAYRTFWRLRVCYCNWQGHDWEENGYANPDSGAIVMDCKRCGYHVSHTLY